jgi:hypothetical protein
MRKLEASDRIAWPVQRAATDIFKGRLRGTKAFPRDEDSIIYFID